MSQRTKIKENNKATMYHYKGKTGFRGCQCFKDCYCKEDFKAEYFEYYSVVRFKNSKKSRHETIKEANERWEFVNSL
jgi:hypothetical protein